MTALLVIDDGLRAHLARAVAEHKRWLRSNGLPAPPDLDTLLDALAATNGQDRTTLAAAAEAVEAVLVSYAVAARRLSVSERTVRRLAAAGRLSLVPVGRRRLIPVAELDELARGKR